MTINIPAWVRACVYSGSCIFGGSINIFFSRNDLTNFYYNTPLSLGFLHLPLALILLPLTLICNTMLPVFSAIEIYNKGMGIKTITVFIIDFAKFSQTALGLIIFLWKFDVPPTLLPSILLLAMISEGIFNLINYQHHDQQEKRKNSTFEIHKNRVLKRKLAVNAVFGIAFCIFVYILGFTNITDDIRFKIGIAATLASYAGLIPIVYGYFVDKSAEKDEKLEKKRRKGEIVDPKVAVPSNKR